MSVQSREVLVIGAGIAGLTAARDLAVDGYAVAILEARERIGGRIWTSHELDVPADLGTYRKIKRPFPPLPAAPPVAHAPFLAVPSVRHRPRWQRPCCQTAQAARRRQGLPAAPEEEPDSDTYGSGRLGRVCPGGYD